MEDNAKDFLALYERYKDKIYNYIWYRVNFDRELSEDLTSEVFIKALENFDSYDGGRPFQAWIYRIAHNHLVNHYRTANRQTELENAAHVASGVEKIDASLECERLLDEINKIDSYHRDVLLLRYVDGLTNAEIADLLGKEEGAVRTQISRALQVIREKLEKYVR